MVQYPTVNDNAGSEFFRFLFIILHYQFSTISLIKSFEKTKLSLKKPLQVVRPAKAKSII